MPFFSTCEVMTVLSHVRRALGATVASILLLTGAVAAPAAAEPREGTITVSAGGYEVTARVVVSDRSTATPYEVPVDIYLEHDGSSISLDRGWVDVTDSAGRQLWAGDSGLTEISEGHLRAVPRLQNGAPIGDYRVSFTAFVNVSGHATPVLVRIGAVDVVTFKVRYRTALEATARSANLPTGAVTTVAGTLGWWVRDAAGEYDPVAATGAVVDIDFDPEGSAPRARVGTATVDGAGFFRLSTRVTGPGRWYVSYAGTEELSPATVSVSQKARAHALPVRQGLITKTSGKATAGIRLTATDVVTTLEPQTVRVDFGVTTFGSMLSTYGVRIDGRRGEGAYPNGRVFVPRHNFTGDSTGGYVTMKMDALTPPGVYDVGADVTIYTCTRSYLVAHPTVGDCGAKDVRLRDDTVTTFTVKRATQTTISASSTKVSPSKHVTFKGSLRTLKPVSKREAAYRPAPNATVRLYWDPAGSAGERLVKTVRTSSKGVWTAKVPVRASGRWTVKFAGSPLNAPSQRSVTVTVR